MDRHHYETFEKFGNQTFLLHLDNGRAWVTWTSAASYQLQGVVWTHVWQPNTLAQVSVIVVTFIYGNLLWLFHVFQVWASLSGWAVHSSSFATVLQVKQNEKYRFTEWPARLKIHVIQELQGVVKKTFSSVNSVVYTIKESRDDKETCVTISFDSALNPHIGSVAPPSSACASCPSLTSVWVMSCESRCSRIL